MSGNETNQANTKIKVNLLGKEYLVSCPVETQQELQASAEYLDGKMREIRASGRVIGLERVLVIAALNITHEIIDARSSYRTLKDRAEYKIQSLVDKLESMLSVD